MTQSAQTYHLCCIQRQKKTLECLRNVVQDRRSRHITSFDGCCRAYTCVVSGLRLFCIPGRALLYLTSSRRLKADGTSRAGLIKWAQKNHLYISVVVILLRGSMCQCIRLHMPHFCNDKDTTEKVQHNNSRWQRQTAGKKTMLRNIVDADGQVHCP